MRGVIFSVAGRDVVFRGSKEDFAEGFFTNGAGGRRWEGGEEGLGFLCEGGPVGKGKIGVGFEFPGMLRMIGVWEGYDNGEVIRSEGGFGVPGEGGDEVGRAEGNVWGGGEAMGGESCGGVFIEEAEGTGIDGFNEGFSTSSSGGVCRGGVPGGVMGIKVTEDDGVGGAV